MFPEIRDPPNHPFGNRVFHYFHHPFWGTVIFLETPIPRKLKAKVEGTTVVYLRGRLVEGTAFGDFSVGRGGKHRTVL